MKYFSAIVKRANELEELGKEYLSPLPFIPNEDVGDRIYNAVLKIWDKTEDKDSLPDWIHTAYYDGYIPYGIECRNGSIYYSLGFSPTAKDAKLRNLLEIVEGREEKELDFSCVAEKEIVEKYCKEK